jgi:hypothetical protein
VAEVLLLVQLVVLEVVLLILVMLLELPIKDMKVVKVQLQLHKAVAEAEVLLLLD